MSAAALYQNYLPLPHNPFGSAPFQGRHPRSLPLCAFSRVRRRRSGCTALGAPVRFGAIGWSAGKSHRSAKPWSFRADRHSTVGKCQFGTVVNTNGYAQHGEQAGSTVANSVAKMCGCMPDTTCDYSTNTQSSGIAKGEAASETATPWQDFLLQAKTNGDSPHFRRGKQTVTKPKTPTTTNLRISRSCAPQKRATDLPLKH